LVQRRHAPPHRHADREGRALVQSIRDPDILACAGGALRNREVRYGRASSLLPGSIFEINAAPMPGGGAVVVLHDVTNVEAAERSRRDFIANVSHELRTPLTSISGYLETLLEDPNPKPETTREFLQIILKNSNRMNRLTEDLLELASVESPDYRIARQPIRASALLERRDRVPGRHGRRLRNHARVWNPAARHRHLVWPTPTP
jgi:two-component system phosphate regulon sensor histidine kinase PhoR